MKRLCVSWAKQTIVLSVFMLAGVLPSYAQEKPTIDDGETTDSRFALSAGGTPAIPVKRKLPAVELDAERSTDSRFALSAGGTPAIRVKSRTPAVEWDADRAAESRFAIGAGETPAIPVKSRTPAVELDAERAADSRFALSAGGTPAIPVRSKTSALELDADRAADLSFAINAGGTPVRLGNNSNQTTNQSGKQTTNDAYVFPTPKERFNRYVKSTVGPFALFRVAASAGIGQWRDKPEEWEQGMSGYGKRLASGVGRNAIQQTITYGLDSALGWDTGFRRSTSTEFGARLKHALLENITSRTRSGKRVISVPRITGAYASGVISTAAWYPERYNYKDGLRSGTNTLLMGFALNLVREFVVKF